MTKIHMETDNVRSLANMLNQQAENLFMKADEVRSASRRLSMGWSGGSNSSSFLKNLDTWARQCETKADELQTLSIRVNREVDEWVSVDAKFQAERAGFGKKFIDEVLDFSFDDATQLVSTVGVMTGITAGTTYAGQVIFHGSQSLKDAAGFFPNLTHIRVDHIPGSLLKNALGKITPIEVGVAVLDFGGKAVEDWGKYEDGSEKATAIALDAAFVTAKTVGLHYAGYALASVATGFLLTAGAPVTLVACAGIATWWGVSYLGGKALDVGFDTFKEDLVTGGGKLLDQAGEAIGDAANDVSVAVSNAAAQITGNIDRGFGEFSSAITSFF